MSRQVSATEARVHFGEIIQRVAESKEHVVVMRSGQPAAVIVSVEEFERLSRAQQPDGWRIALERVNRAREATRAELEGREVPSVDEMIEEGREERDERIAGVR